MAAVFLWMADDSGLDWIQLKPSGDNVRELFILKAQRSAFDAAMSGRALKALGEVAPVAGGCHGAGLSMRAWRHDSGALLNQEATRSIDCSEAALCARLNQDEKFLCAAPGTAKDLLKKCGRKLAQCIGDEDCVMRLELFRSAQVSLHPQCIANGCIGAENWLESGQLLGKIRARTGFTPEKLRDLHFDVLIALTARSYGARLITSNRGDFELISSYKKIDLEIW